MRKKPSSSASGPASAPKQRPLRVGELIRRSLSEILSRGDLHDPDLASQSITVGEVRLSPDLRVATAYVLPLGGVGAEATLEALRRNKAELRHRIGAGMTIRHIPDLKFELDDTYDRIEATARLFADRKVRADLAVQDEDGPDTPDPTP